MDDRESLARLEQLIAEALGIADSMRTDGTGAGHRTEEEEGTLSGIGISLHAAELGVKRLRADRCRDSAERIWQLPPDSDVEH